MVRSISLHLQNYENLQSRHSRAGRDHGGSAVSRNGHQHVFSEPAENWRVYAGAHGRRLPHGARHVSLHGRHQDDRARRTENAAARPGDYGGQGRHRHDLRGGRGEVFRREPARPQHARRDGGDERHQRRDVSRAHRRDGRQGRFWDLRDPEHRDRPVSHDADFRRRRPRRDSVADDGVGDCADFRRSGARQSR